MTTIKLQLEDEASLNAAKPIIEEANLTVSWVIERVFRRIAKDGCIHVDLFSPSEATLEAMRECEEGNLRSFPDVESLMADLNAEE